MKRILTLAIAATMMVACSKDATQDFIGGTSDNKAASSLLQVRTRAGGGDGATVSYPVQVYVFQGEECKAVQTIGDEGQTLNIALVEGTYSVYAVGGASSTDYTLPTKDDATTTSAIALKEGQTLTDLMAATASVTLIDGGTNTVTLGMERKVMLIQDITINKIPTAATAVSVTIAPLWQNVTIGGTFSGTTGSNTIALTRQDDNRTWKLPAPQGVGSGSVFLLPPSSQPASVSVNVTIGGTTTTYTYSTSDQLEAGYKINIEGTYTEAVGVSLTGTITGAAWLGERTIAFSFDESGSTPGTPSGNNDNTDPTPTGAGSEWLPAAGTAYQGCTVLAATATGDDTADLLLLAPASTEAQLGTTTADPYLNTTIDYILSTVATATGISGWRLPAYSDMTAFAASAALTAGRGYLYYDAASALRQYTTGSPWPAAATAATATTYVRPVAEVSISKE